MTCDTGTEMRIINALQNTQKGRFILPTHTTSGKNPPTKTTIE